ncbi:MAG: protein kinase, partial [Vicinamibacterales bacterium]
MAGELAAGTVLDGTYVLQDAIGGGRSGRVYRAVHLALQRPVAVKVLHGGDDTPAEAFARFRVEAEALGRLAHPHVVAVTDFGIDPRDGGVPYLVMDLVDGRALRAALATDEAADLEVAASWLRQLADALAYAHARGVVHGDVSADNVLISSDGPVRRVTLLDFGLAWLVEAASEAAERVPEPGLFTPVATTLDYCAPERLRGEAPSAAGDVYALAVLAYRILTGRFPFGGEPKALRHAHLTADPPPASSRVPDLPPALDALLADGLAKRPDARPTAAEFAVRIGDAARTLARARWRRREFPRRLAVASALAAAAMATAATLAPTEPLRRAEGVSEDVRFAAAAGRPADPRLLLVAIDDRALAADPRPLSLRADEFAAGVSRAFAAGADGVAIDLLLPATWASSETFGTLLLEHGDRLVVGMTSDGATVVGPEAVDPLVAQALGAERANRLFGLVATPVGPDGVVRRARAVVADVTGAPRALLAGQLAAHGRGVDVLPAEPVVVDYRTPAAAIERMDWTT